MGEPAFSARASGILVPSTIAKDDYTLPNADFVKMRRLMKFARDYGLRAMYFCEVCEKPVSLEQHDRIITEIDGPNDTKKNAPGGRLTLSCGCSRWVIR